MTLASTGWHVVYTKPRQERVAEENLLRQHYETWLPLIGKWTRRAPGWACEAQPMFPRYLFLRTTDAQQSLAPVRSTLGPWGSCASASARRCWPTRSWARCARLAAQTREPEHPLRTGARCAWWPAPSPGCRRW